MHQVQRPVAKVLTNKKVIWSTQCNSAREKARAIQHHWNDSIVYDDKLICHPQAGIFRSNTSSDLNQITVYPNPSNDYLFIKAMQKGVLDIYDVNGSLIRSLKIENGLTQLDVSSFISGLYCLKLTEQNSHISICRFTIIK